MMGGMILDNTILPTINHHAPFAIRYRRFFVSGSFAIAASIPSFFFYWVFWEETTFPFYFNTALVFGPMAAAALCGYRIGARILDRTTTPRIRNAIVVGLHVAGLAYLLFLVFISICYATMGMRSTGDIGFLLQVSMLIFGYGFIYGLLVVGWLIVIMSIIAGWLLYRYRDARR
jgi:hypothetical protein